MTKEEKEKIRQAKEYLSQLTMLAERISTLQTDLMKATYPGGVFPGGGGSSMPSDLSCNVQRKLEAEKRLWKKVHEFELRKDEIMLEISEMENNKYALILHKRYVQQKSWKQISGELAAAWGRRCEWRSLMRDHCRALLAFHKSHFGESCH